LGFLQKLIGLVLTPILTWIAEKLTRLIKDYIARKEAKAEIEKANKEVREKVETAVTPVEREDAASETIRRF
jgi:hypothetical protein